MSPIQLRPHHGLCIPRFEGRGYSDQFVRKMARLAEQLRKHPQATVRLCCGPDQLCGSCPNRQALGCSSDKPSLYDQRCLKHINLTEGSVLTWEQLQQLLADADVSAICDSCRWLPICTKKREKANGF